jgi:glutamine cyclotransferase
MEENESKVTWKIKITIIIMVCIFYWAIFIFGYEERLSSNKMADVFVMNNVTVNSTILFETNDYIITKKITRYALSFTQGFFMDTENTMIESGGLYKQSTLQRYNIDKPDEPIYKMDLPDNVFAEGCTLFKGKIYQLTWKEKTM